MTRKVSKFQQIHTYLIVIYSSQLVVTLVPVLTIRHLPNCLNVSFSNGYYPYLETRVPYLTMDFVNQCP